MRLFFSAGEASGDAYAAEIVARLGKGWEVEGIGGHRLRAISTGPHVDSSKWGAIGIVEACKVVPRVIRGYRQARVHLASGPPGIFVPIDFGYVNIKLARWARRHSWKVMYFIPPGSWRKDRQGADLPRVSDVIVTPFSWSADLLRQMGGNAHWFGHPLKQMVGDHISRETAEPLRDAIAILPGSRLHEIHHNLTAIAPAIEQMKLAEPVRFAVASTVRAEDIQSQWKSLAPGRQHDEFIEADRYRVLRSARAAIVCSGTATLEAALCRCPTVVVYRSSWLTELEFRLRRPQFDFISLPNILLNRALLPELIQHDASPGRIAQETSDLLEGTARAIQLDGFEELDQVLGPACALTETARVIQELAGKNPPG